MRRRNALTLSTLAALVAFPGGCMVEEPSGGGEGGANPFLEDQTDPGKDDTAYYNPDGVEVEIDLEAEVEAPSGRIFDAPALVGQYALTYLRQRGQMYLESIAEIGGSRDRVEWLVNDEWLTTEQARSVPAAQLRRFRIRGLNAVLLFQAASGAEVGHSFAAEVPLRPYGVMSEAGAACAEPDGHLELSQSIYWYMWDPDRSGCEVPTVQASVTIASLFRTSAPTYPEYDRLVEDGRVTAVVLFGQIGDGPITDSDTGVRAFNQMARWLVQAGFEEVANPPVGRRFHKVVAGLELEYDLYSPRDFSGLSDYAHYANFQRALSEHEIVVYDGHSMLGASDFWSRPDYPEFYQIFLYGGCLGYEYYVQPILAGKGGWENLDIMSSVVEVSVSANEFAGPFLAKLEWALEHDFSVTWDDLLQTVRRRVGDSTFGASGVSGNCYTPTGSRCGGEPPAGEPLRFANDEALPIPDNDPAGVASVIEVTEAATPSAVSVELEVTHTWVGDLRIVLAHGGNEVVVWDRAGGSAHDIRQTVPLESFAGQPLVGAWTLRIADEAAQDTGTLVSWAIVAQP